MTEPIIKDRLPSTVIFGIVNRDIGKLTNSIIEPVRERLETRNLNGLRTNVLEDGILTQVQKGVSTTASILEGMGNDQVLVRAEAMMTQVAEYRQQVDFTDVFSEARQEEIKSDFINILVGFGVSQGEAAKLSVFQFKLIDTDGQYMQKEPATVSINTRQIIRKALDFVQIFPEYEMKDVLSGLIVCTAGHELGHEIDRLFFNVISQIPMSEGWGGEGINSLERKKERFAEYWGRAALKNDKFEEIVNLEWALQVAKVNELWIAVERWNNEHEEKVNLMEIFHEIKNCSKNDYPLTNNLIKIREAGYFDTATENYASPYPEKVVKRAFSTTLSNN